MGKLISTYWADDNKGRAEVHLDAKNESFYIKYFVHDAQTFWVEDVEGSLSTVEAVAEDWCLGYHKLFEDKT